MGRTRFRLMVLSVFLLLATLGSAREGRALKVCVMECEHTTFNPYLVDCLYGGGNGCFSCLMVCPAMPV